MSPPIVIIPYYIWINSYFIWIIITKMDDEIVDNPDLSEKIVDTTDIPKTKWQEQTKIT